MCFPSLAAAGVLEYRWLERWKVFENFVRDQMAATAQGQQDTSACECLAGSTVPQQEDVKVPKKNSCQCHHWRGQSGEEEETRCDDKQSHSPQEDEEPSGG